MEEWATRSHLKDSTIDILRNNEVDSVAVARLLTSEDIKVLILHIFSLPSGCRRQPLLWSFARARAKEQSSRV